MNEEYAIKQLNQIYEVLQDSSSYPECLDIINNQVICPGTDETFLTCNVFELASMFHDADGALPMHPLVANFCLEVYFDEYAKGNADAACNLGSLFYTGRAGEQSYAKAVEYYTFAAENGSRQAQENLGYCYYYGRDVEKDYEKAFHFFLLGALDGHLRSLYKIGDFYKNGYYVKKNENEAFHIYEHCAEMMSDEVVHAVGADVYMRLGECYHKGIGTEKNFDLALRLYQMAEGEFFLRLREGDFMIKKNLERTIKAEDEVRNMLMTSMPGK